MSEYLVSASPLQSNGSRREASGMDQTTKPLPRLPRGFSRACHETSLFLRSIGLGIFVSSFHGFFTKNFREPEKVAIRQNRVTALLRALIHVMPLGLAIFEIILNWKGHYAGSYFDKQNHLQFVAKAHEIFMQASIATIILSYIRYQLSAGNGMPFGAVLGSLQFMQVSYLWSTELWSAITSKDFKSRKRFFFTGLIFICITLAATAGPSSANLLIARQGIWPSESKYIAVNATFQDIWPDRLDDDQISSYCNNIQHTVTNHTQRLCPISMMYGTMPDQHLFLRALENYEHSRNNSSTDLILQIPGTQYASLLTTAGCFQNRNGQVCSSIPQQRLSAGLMESSPTHSHQTALEIYRTMKENYFQPYAAVSCVDDTVRNSSDQTALRFARISESVSELKTDPKLLPVPGLTKGHSTANIPGNSSRIRSAWVDLPQEIFRTQVPGAVFVHPQSPHDSSYNITACTINAGWGSSEITNVERSPWGVSGKMTQIPPSWPFYSHPLDAYGHQSESLPSFANMSNFYYPQRRLSISKSWMEFNTPTFVLPDNSTTNTFTELLSLLSYQPSEAQVAWVLNAVLVAALSTVGMEYEYKVFDQRAQASASCESCLIFKTENFLYGWTYTARETTTKLAIAVMVTYCIIVLAHIIYSAISGVSSTAWDSVAELVTLAMNSSPTETLQNTCAGVIGKAVYQTQVRVLKTSEKHLELVFGEVKDPYADISKLVMNEKYGRMPVRKEDESGKSNVEVQGELQNERSKQREIRKRVLG